MALISSRRTSAKSHSLGLRTLSSSPPPAALRFLTQSNLTCKFKELRCPMQFPSSSHSYCSAQPL